MAGLQCYLTKNFSSHRYGASHSNQRIENWWSHFRRSFSGWAIDHFKELVHDGKFITDNMKCIWFVYANLFKPNQRKLNKSGIIIKQDIRKVVKFLKFRINYIIYLNLKVIFPKVSVSPSLMLKMLQHNGIMKISSAKLRGKQIKSQRNIFATLFIASN